MSTIQKQKSVLKDGFRIFFLNLMFMGICFAETAQKPSGKVKFSDEKLTGTGVTELVFSLLLVIGAILLVAWLLRRVNGLNAGTSGVVRVLGGTSVGTREKILLVEVGKEQILVGVAPGRVQALHVLPEPVETGNEKQKEIAFADRLKSALGRGKP